MAKYFNPLTVFAKEFESDGIKYELEFRMNTNKFWDQREREKLGRAFVWTPDSAEHGRLVAEIEVEVKRVQEECRKAHKRMPKSKYTRRGEYPTIDKAWDRLNRQIVKEYKKVLNDGLAASEIEIRESALDPKVLDYSELDCVQFPEYLPKIKTFHKKAGCGCGCSPGFIMDRMRGYEIFVNEVKEV